MQRLLGWLGWALVVAAVALLLSPFLADSFFDPLKNAVPAGVLVALAANLLTQAKNAADTSEKRSQFHLESAIKAYEQAKSLISDGNNDRAKWIEAGRCLGHAKVLVAGVALDAHQRVLEFNQLKFRSFFHELLASKSGAFFYGSTDPSATLEDAARAASAPTTRNGRTTVSGALELDESSIRAVWEAAQWPKDYKDSLGECFSEKESGMLFVLFPALHGYLEHRKKWHSAAGQLFSRKTGNDSSSTMKTLGTKRTKVWAGLGIALVIVMSFVYTLGGFGATSSINSKGKISKKLPENARGPVLLRVNMNGIYGYIDTTGRFVIDPQFDDAWDFDPESGLAVIQLGDKYGYIDKTGKIVIDPQFDYAYDFDSVSGLARVQLSSKWWTRFGKKYGYIDKTGKIAIDRQFDNAGDFDLVSGLAVIELGDKYGYIDKTGRAVIEPLFDDAFDFHHASGLARIKLSGKYGYIDKTGKILIHPQFDHAQDFDSASGLALIKKGDKLGYIDMTGRIVINPQFVGADGFDSVSGLARVRFGEVGVAGLDDKYGYINKTGVIVIKPVFDSAFNFDASSGLARVSLGDKTGFIDKTGKIVIDLKFDSAGDFDYASGLARVSLDGMYGYIDKTGKIVIKPQFDY